jgi:colanic acid/amylovoran biosynthesis glycosyltransferase
MLTVAYLANQFPSAVEPYVAEEIEELRGRGIRVIAGSVRRPVTDEGSARKCAPEIVLQPLKGIVLLPAISLCMRQWKRISPLIARVLFHSAERPLKRMKALVHTGLGACYAALLEGQGVEHIHVHHGYFGSWIAMVAARLLGVEFSMTLHGSDLLLHGTYLDVKLESCAFCLTVSEYNRRYILERYPKVDAEKVIVARLGVEVSQSATLPAPKLNTKGTPFTILAMGRLHVVKDHAFLVKACAQLQRRGLPFECFIAGDGPEWCNLRSLIREYGLEDRVTLLGHVSRRYVNSWYDRADVVVLTSRSEGIPLVLMEAMARGKIVLAPDITGIPELVTAGKTGFLYEAGSLNKFVARLLFIRSLMHAPDDPQLSPYIFSAARQLDRVRHAAQAHILHNFNRRKSLELFGDLFLQRVAAQAESVPHENFVLQQI